MSARSRTTTAVRFDADLHARVMAEAEARDVSMNWIINRLVREGLERMVPLTELRLTGPAPQGDAQ